jgi:hypothetical protein
MPELQLPIGFTDMLAFLVDHPFLVFLTTLFFMWIAGSFGAIYRRFQHMGAAEHDDFDVIQAATLTLLALIIGFSFSMALTRYDQRKNLEEEEANAIGTEYLRADILPAQDAGKVRALLRQYADLRVQFYETHEEDTLAHINAQTAGMQSELWSAVLPGGSAQPTPPMALVLSGMNDVINSQGYTQAAWWNRIPLGAWLLMFAIAFLANTLVGSGSRSTQMKYGFLGILPLIVGVAFMLIADIDSARHGLIRLKAQNLEALAESLRPQAQ